MKTELRHHGILGQKWGVRRYQNTDGTLTEAGRRRLERKDMKWAERHQEKLMREQFKLAGREMSDYSRNTLDRKYGKKKYTSRGQLNSNYVNEYNKKLAEIMNRNIEGITAPSGRTVQFVAKRGEVGVHMALADRGYDMRQVRNGVYNSGKIAYRNKSVQMG